MVSASKPKSELMTAAIRAFVRKADHAAQENAKAKNKKKTAGPSEWVLVFDTETTTDAAQQLRFGTYQVRRNGELHESGIFYASNVLTREERKCLQLYAEEHGVQFLTKAEFVDSVFYKVGYFYRGTIVGFNLPFDISRLAIDHCTARSNRFNKIMAGGFSFRLTEDPFLPRVQIKHISSRDAFIQFTALPKQRTSKSHRKRGRKQPVRRGFFVDCKTLAAALTSQSHSLASLAKALGVEAQKLVTEEHGRTITDEYITYAMQDVKSTWQCFEQLKSIYKTHGLTLTDAHNIHSEASLGKAYLKEMGVQPWRALQPDFPDEILGHIMSAYYGGRSEVHIRRAVTQVLYTDFLSMYPTVCTLMGLWRFVTAKGMTWHDSTEDTKEFLKALELSQLQNPATWQQLSTIVQVIPDEDIFPVRAKYNGDAQYTIGANYLTSEIPMWFTLADCIASILLTEKVPAILQAITFEPGETQEGLKPVNVAGKGDYFVDPTQGDFFKRVIDLRSQVKAAMKGADAQTKATLSYQQLALKILANATSYGIFVELNAEGEKQAQELLCYSNSDHPIPIKKSKYEATGKYFHPLLAALITGAARLMLAITERLIHDAGLEWDFCDTDSMAMAKPEGMSQQDFFEKAGQVQDWFNPLNPYAGNTPLLKIEEYNYSLSDSEKLAPLYCLAISSKRYALFNLDKNGKVILRKVSAHGLGHLKAPYHRINTSVLEGALPWQQDFWQEIIEAELGNRHPDFSKLPGFTQPAISRYAATTPALLKWCDGYNQDKPYQSKIKPFNFLVIPQADIEHKYLKPIAPFSSASAQVLEQCFDRESGKKIDISHLKTYLDVLAQYHLHQESKFLHGEYLDKGKTERRRITVNSIQYIGKEANKWEEQLALGYDSDAQITYTTNTETLDKVRESIKKYGINTIAKIAKVSERYLRNICHLETTPSETILSRVLRAVANIESTNSIEQELCKSIRQALATKGISLRQLSEQLSIDPSNLSKILSGKRGNLEQLSMINNYLMLST